MNPQDAYELAGDLLADLAEHIGDEAAVAEVLHLWHRDLERDDLALVALATVWRVFTECLSLVDAVPPGATRFTERSTTE